MIRTSNTANQRRVPAIISLMLLCWWPAAAQSEEDAADQIIDLLSQRFFEVEFFVFERPAVMDFNTREILLHKTPVSYPPQMTTFPYPEQAVGNGYQLDPLTLLCMVYPTLTYTSTPLEGAATDELLAAESTQAGEETDSVDPEQTLTDETGNLLDPISAPIIEPEVSIDPLAELRTAVSAFEQTLVEQSNQWRTEDTLQLTREARQVERRAGGRILFHGRWLQAVPAREAPMAILLPDTAVTGPGSELSGTVDVTLGRFLHFRARLNYVAPALGAAPYQLALNPNDEAVPALEAELPANGFMTLNQSRRMRSEELHYLDHPKLGIVVRIDPVSVPESLLEMYTRLTEDPE